jgi:hypothetical protein
MMKQLLTRGATMCVAAAFVGLPALAVNLTAQPKPIPPFDGVWKLNVEASTNPNGPPPPARGRGGRGGGRGGGGAAPGGPSFAVGFAAVQEGGSGGSGGGAGNIGGSAGGTIGNSLSGEEEVRFNQMRDFLLTAPAMMGVQATATDFTLVLDPVKKLGFQHKLDNRAVALNTAGGPGQFKARWDGSKIRREVETKESLKVTEDYELSRDTKQLIVTVKYDAIMVRMQKMDVRRVYDRVATPTPAAQ